MEFLKKPGQLPNFDQNSRVLDISLFLSVKNKCPRSALLCPQHYLSESCPEMKEPMRTPTKKREVVSGAFQSSSHTRFHCKRKA